MVVLVEAEHTYQDLKHREHGDHIKLGLQRLVVEYAHAQKRADGAAEPGPEKEGVLGDAAGVLFRARLIVAVQDERDEVDQDEPVDEDHEDYASRGETMPNFLQASSMTSKSLVAPKITRTELPLW